MKSRFSTAVVWFAVMEIAVILWNPAPARATDRCVPFDGGKSAWHDGFDRDDFVIDEVTLNIKPFKAPEGEKFGVRDPGRGRQRCILIVPTQRDVGAGVSALERDLDGLMYALYGLTPEEIELVEGTA